MFYEIPGPSGDDGPPCVGLRVAGRRRETDRGIAGYVWPNWNAIVPVFSLSPERVPGRCDPNDKHGTGKRTMSMTIGLDLPRDRLDVRRWPDGAARRFAEAAGRLARLPDQGRCR